MGLTNWQQELKAQHKCVDCGGYIDNIEKYIRCPKCRDIQRTLDIRRRMEYEARQRRLREMQNPNEEQAKQIQENIDRKIEEMERRRRRAKDIEDKQKRFIRCTKCSWVTYTGSGWYCPLPYCWMEA